MGGFISTLAPVAMRGKPCRKKCSFDLVAAGNFQSLSGLKAYCIGTPLDYACCKCCLRTCSHPVAHATRLTSFNACFCRGVRTPGPKRCNFFVVAVVSEGCHAGGRLCT